ncbi:MAG: ATP-binding cassette domain-containing protein [Candidatus Competibacteraceae bacterium]|nr:ATP-binding cassette domain-containing protein [Candidatus Competibacteraceae bacterium]
MSPRKPNEQPVLELKNIHKSFGDRQILKGVSFNVYAGEMLGLIGPSGCGKSTILKIICGLLEPDQGEVIKRSDEIGLVFQGSALLNSLTVRENLAIALQRRKLGKAEENRIISERLKMVGLEGYEDYSPTKLSGGQQKRTSFARAIVNDPKIILYDEPTTGLDPVMSTIIEDYMIELEEKLQAACIVVTHQYSTWTRAADRILLMHAGKIVWEGTPEEGINSEDQYMKQFAHATREGPMLAGAFEG